MGSRRRTATCWMHANWDDLTPSSALSEEVVYRVSRGLVSKADEAVERRGQLRYPRVEDTLSN
jgi:hypothetical protein